MASVKPIQLLPQLYLLQDTCNVYLLRDGDRAIAIDFASGQWLECLGELGISHLDHVFLTHHHADQCFGLSGYRRHQWKIHAPAGEEKFLEPAIIRKAGTFCAANRGCPSSYAVHGKGIPDVCFDMVPSSDIFWRSQRLRFMHTPGHGPNACSVVADVDGRQVVFCGDAAHAGATIWQPHHLEWDHWTGAGALAAWEGVVRLRDIAVDLLCPAHGQVISTRPRQLLARLAGKLMRFYQAKGSICPGEPDRYITPRRLACGAHQVLPGLYQFGKNGYLLQSVWGEEGEGLVIDPDETDMPAMEQLVAEIGIQRIPVATVTHYHNDHCSGLAYLRKHYETRSILHPRVAQAWSGPMTQVVPFGIAAPPPINELWPEEGWWQWNEYRFRIAAMPGQTWWHCGFMTSIHDSRVVFTGDSFQPASRWKGTGGFCAYNDSRFEEGFNKTARLLLAWKPDICAAGHGTFYSFSPSYFRKVIRWAAGTAEVVRALCPTGDLKSDYYCIPAAKRKRDVKRPSEAASGELYWLKEQG